MNLSPERERIFHLILRGIALLLGLVGSFVGIARFFGILIAVVVVQSIIIGVMGYYLCRLRKVPVKAAPVHPDMLPSNR